MWLKYRHKFTSGTNKDWEWKDIGDSSEDFIKDEISDLSEEYNWSEHYRGVEHEVHEYPPLEVLRNKIHSLIIDIRYKGEYLESLESLYKIVKTIKEEENHE